MIDTMLGENIDKIEKISEFWKEIKIDEKTLK